MAAGKGRRQTLREHLFPMRPDGQPESAVWFAPLVDEVRRELDRLAAGAADQRPALRQEHDELGRKVQGWTMTLGNPSLPSFRPSAGRGPVARRPGPAARGSGPDGLLGRGGEGHRTRSFLETEVAKRLKRLAEVLAANNPTLGNLELSLHIDRIDCFSDHRVVMRTCRLGSLAGVAGLLREDRREETLSRSSAGIHVVKPRRRAKLRLDHLDGEAAEIEAAAELAIDPARFGGLDERWFWIDAFQMPGKQSWAKRHAADVWRLRCVEKITWAEIGRRLGKTMPTLRQALKFAEQRDADAQVDAA